MDASFFNEMQKMSASIKSASEFVQPFAVWRMLDSISKTQLQFNKLSSLSVANEFRESISKVQQLQPETYFSNSILAEWVTNENVNSKKATAALIEAGKLASPFKKLDVDYWQPLEENYNRISEILKSITTASEFTTVFKEFNYSSLFQYDFEELITEHNEEEREIVIDESKRIQRIVCDIYKDDKRLYTLDPRAFEELIAELLNNRGFKVELTPKTRDGGYDILALRSIDRYTKLKFLVECKRYAPNRAVGVEIIRSFNYVVQDENANQGIIVTTSYFSKDAWNMQKATPYLLDFKERNDIMEWIHDYYLSMLGV